MAYTQEPNVTDFNSGYLGDQGSSSGNADFGSFSVPYSDNTSIYILAQSNFGPTTCEFEFSIAWATCPNATLDIIGGDTEDVPTEDVARDDPALSALKSDVDVPAEWD